MWFAGSVSEAISQTRRDQKLLLVFVESAGGDDVSNRSKQSLESLSDQILTHCVPIKLTAESESANQFSQFYPILVVPATYIINAAGVAVEAIAGEVKSDVFLSKLEAAAATSAGVKVTSDDTVMNQGSESPCAPSPDRTAAPPPSPASPPQQPELEEKIAMAQRKLEELKARKEKEEEEAERQREVERCEVGKAVLSAKRKREEMEMIEAANERKRDAALEREHRAKVLAQIELDKEERRKRFGMSSNSSSQSSESQQHHQTQQTQPRVNCDETRIQFRFPDGHTLTHVFKSGDALSLAWDFVANTENKREFILSQMYPRKTFAGEEMAKTFSDLQLVPSAVLLVLSASSSTDSPSSNRSAVTQGAVWWSYLLPGFLLMPLITIWNFITSFLPSSSPSGSPDQQSSSASSSSSTRNSGSQPVREPDPQPSTSGLRRRDLPSRSGNIHRLHNDSDDDEEKKKKTWNGNSTQQM